MVMRQIDKVLKLKVKDVMSKGIIAVEENATVDEAAKKMKDNEVGCILVAKENKVLGIITERDMVRRVLAEEKDPKETQVKDIMSKPVIAVREEADVEEAVAIMVKNGIRRLPVISSDNKLVGIVTAKDLATALAELSKLETTLFNALARIRPPPKEMYG